MSIQEAITKLRSYSKFKHNWDLQGAKPANGKSIHHAIAYILNNDAEPYIVGLTKAGHALVEYMRVDGVDSDFFIFLENGKYDYSVIEREKKRFIQY